MAEEKFKKITGLWKCKNQKGMYHVRLSEDIHLQAGDSLLIQKNQYKDKPEDPDYVIILIKE